MYMWTCLLQSPDEFIRQEITFRYNTLKYRSSVLTSRLQEVNEIVKLKNPSLFLQIQVRRMQLINHFAIAPSTLLSSVSFIRCLSLSFSVYVRACLLACVHTVCSARRKLRPSLHPFKALELPRAL